MIRKPFRWGLSGTTPGIIHQANMNQTTHKGTGCQNHGRGLEEKTISGLDTAYKTTLYQQPHNLSLLEIKARLGLNNLLHPCTVQIAVSLRPRSSNCWPLLGIK